jgi:hypothetical protein
VYHALIVHNATIVYNTLFPYHLPNYVVEKKEQSHPHNLGKHIVAIRSQLTAMEGNAGPPYIVVNVTTDDVRTIENQHN